MRNILIIAVLLVACMGITLAQTGVEPVTLNLGPTAGVLLPSGDFSNVASTGWTAGAFGRFGGILPFGGLTASFCYGQLPTNPSSDYHFSELNLAVGAEYTIPAEGFKPYVGLDLMYNNLSNNYPGSTSASREGLGIGGGVFFMNAINVDLKYQMINLLGKDTGEGTYNQIAIKVAYLFPVL